MKKITFGDLRIGKTARWYMKRALSKNWVSQGDNVREFEQKFEQKFGYGYAVATSSGTDACICACAALHDLGAKRGDEIIVPACTFVATANAVLAAGFTPRFVDVELKTLNIDPSKIEDAITLRTVAIMPVHLMGKSCRMDEIIPIANLHGLRVIEDACEAHGAEYGGRVVGNWGDMACFSFYAAHLIVAGEGGMVVTRDREFQRGHHIADILMSVRSHGRPPGSIHFYFQRVGFNSRMNDMEAAIGLEGLENFDDTFKKRKRNLYRLLELTEDLKDYCHFIREESYEVVSPHAFPLVLKDPKFDRDRFYAYLEERGIECKTLFGSLPTQHNAFKFLGYKLGDFPVAEYVGENGLHFGCHQYLTGDDLIYIGETLREYFRSA